MNSNVATNSQTFGYSLFIFQFEQNSSLDYRLASEISKQLDVITSPKDQTHIDVWLESGGGSADAAYKILLELRSRACSIHCVVPDYAKSAATLMVLGMDQIHMAPAAELGPLDVQVTHPDRENVDVSGLDVVNSLSYIVNAAADMVLANGAKFIRATRLTRAEVLREELLFMSNLLQPIMGKIDPSLLHQASNRLQVAEKYAERLLALRNVDEEHTLNPRQATDMCRKFVRDYPAHGFVISRDEARKRLGLPIFNAEDHRHWAFGKLKYDEACGAGRDLIRVFPHEEIDQSTKEKRQNADTQRAADNGGGHSTVLARKRSPRRSRA